MQRGVFGGVGSIAFGWMAVASIGAFGLAAVPLALGPGSAQSPGVVQPGGCQPGWVPTFGGQPGLNNWVEAMTVFDDGGGGPALFVGGTFSSAGGAAANGVAKWDGACWSALGSGLDGGVRALTGFDDGSGVGPALYAAGLFTSAGGVPASRIAKWNGTDWSPLGAGLNFPVRALTVFDDGSGGGPALYAGGYFTVAGGVAASHVARWDGTSWSALGSGTNGWVNALAVFDDGRGGGPALYAGGYFTSAGGVVARRIARWDGTSWSPLGSGMSDGWVNALTVFDDGSGGRTLCAGGRFTSAGGVPTGHIAAWDGESWSPLGGLGRVVEALAVFGDGSGGAPVLYAGHTLNGGISWWTGSNWSLVGGGANSSVWALAVCDLQQGAGPELYAAGGFTSMGGMPASGIAKWDGASWGALGNGLNDDVEALTVFEGAGGGGPALYAGGNFDGAGGMPLSRIAKWDGASWTGLGSGLDDDVEALTVFDDAGGGGPALYAGGRFTSAGGVAVSRIAKWDGTSWSALGSGLSSNVSALTTFDDGSGSGPALHVGGEFASAGGVLLSYIAKWDGASWSPLGSGMSSGVFALTTFDDGSGGGLALYAGGFFTGAGGLPASRIAKWDGASWSALGSGLDGTVWALATHDDGSGPALYVGGDFTSAGGLPASRIARWDGTGWSALGSGLNGTVSALTTYDDGSGGGLALFAGGYFTTAGGMPASYIAKWDGASWSALGSGMSDWVRTLTVFDDGGPDGPALHAGGSFVAIDSHDTYLARWGGCPASAGTTYCTAGTSASGCRAALAASGVPSATAAGGFVLSAGEVEGAKDGLFFFGTGGRQASPWGNGTSYQCVVPPVQRAPLLTAVGTAGLCDGAFWQDLNALWTAQPAKNPGPGALVQAQLWYRDPLSTSNQTTSLSDAIEFAVSP